MKTLLILRHAKSGWGDPTLVDHQRPLNDRGVRDAPRVGRYLVEANLVPDGILSSTATRAHDTATAVADACGFVAQVESTDALYHADPGTLAEVIGERGGFRDRLLVVAHNPGIEEFVSRLADRPERMPTAALAVFEVDVLAWSRFDLDAPTSLVTVWRPKERE